MKQILLCFLCMVSASVFAVSDTPHSMRVECGSWIELKATPYEDYHFVEWNDHNTESVRRIQVNEDASFVAFFGADCEEYANWPVVALYDWLLMLNVREINAMGYYVAADNVTWYRIVGEPDDMHDNFPLDDEPVAHGLYLTLAQNLQGTGDYYAVADVSDAKGMLCDGLMRSVIVHYANRGQQRQVSLLPNIAERGATLRLVGINPDEETTIRIYDATGSLIRTYTTIQTDTYYLQAESVAGCYQVHVQAASYSETLRYIVKK